MLSQHQKSTQSSVLLYPAGRKNPHEEDRQNRAQATARHPGRVYPSSHPRAPRGRRTVGVRKEHVAEGGCIKTPPEAT